jgi:hypothetical protein
VRCLNDQALTPRDKVLQTVIIRVDKEHLVTGQVGAAFFRLPVYLFQERSAENTLFFKVFFLLLI